MSLPNFSYSSAMSSSPFSSSASQDRKGAKEKDETVRQEKEKKEQRLSTSTNSSNSATITISTSYESSSSENNYNKKESKGIKQTDESNQEIELKEVRVALSPSEISSTGSISSSSFSCSSLSSSSTCLSNSEINSSYNCSSTSSFSSPNNSGNQEIEEEKVNCCWLCCCLSGCSDDYAIVIRKLRLNKLLTKEIASAVFDSSNPRNLLYWVIDRFALDASLITGANLRRIDQMLHFIQGGERHSFARKIFNNHSADYVWPGWKLKKGISCRSFSSSYGGSLDCAEYEDAVYQTVSLFYDNDHFSQLELAILSQAIKYQQSIGNSKQSIFRSLCEDYNSIINVGIYSLVVQLVAFEPPRTPLLYSALDNISCLSSFEEALKDVLHDYFQFSCHYYHDSNENIGLSTYCIYEKSGKDDFLKLCFEEFICLMTHKRKTMKDFSFFIKLYDRGVLSIMRSNLPPMKSMRQEVKERIPNILLKEIAQCSNINDVKSSLDICKALSERTETYNDLFEKLLLSLNTTKRSHRAAMLRIMFDIAGFDGLKTAYPLADLMKRLPITIPASIAYSASSSSFFSSSMKSSTPNSNSSEILISASESNKI
jgi:hypothetical protein